MQDRKGMIRSFGKEGGGGNAKKDRKEDGKIKKN